MDIEDINKKKYSNEIINEFKSSNITNANEFIKYIRTTYKINLSKSDLIYIYNKLNLNDIKLKQILTKKIGKSYSGIVSISILTDPYQKIIYENGDIKTEIFTCKNNCHFCPNEIGQPRSYLKNEPAVLRANKNNFSPKNQIYDRFNTLLNMGHEIDKIELIILGGTWCHHTIEYQEYFINNIYYAINTFYEDREIKSLDEEVKINENSKIHIIGLTLETRSDSINLEEIKRLRRYGCTRVQIGCQHTNDEILKKNNRGHGIESVKKAIKILKNNCFKIDIHIMLNLYGSSILHDEMMLYKILNDEYLQCDQIKIYPCAIVPFTKIKELYEEGKYIPYDEKYLYELIKDFKNNIPKWWRINRIIRDIPGTYIIDGYKNVNMRQKLENDKSIKCKCIRCKEIKNNKIDTNDIKLYIEKYNASDGIEYFISYESTDYLIGFIRLRLNKNYENTLPILIDCGLIRELHVYGILSKVGDINELSMQHLHLGRKLIAKAEEIAKKNNYNKIAIISGIGVREYYRKFNYNLIDTYMIKNL